MPIYNIVHLGTSSILKVNSSVWVLLAIKVVFKTLVQLLKKMKFSSSFLNTPWNLGAFLIVAC